MRYIVKKRGGVWVVDTDGAYISFENYTAAVDTAHGAADVFRRSKILSNRAALLVEMPLAAVHRPRVPQAFPLLLTSSACRRCACAP
jgi:hypothetical protein